MRQANGQRVHRDAQPLRQVAVTIDLLPQRVAVVPTTSSRCSGWSFWNNSRGSRDAGPQRQARVLLRHSRAIRMRRRGDGVSTRYACDGRPPAG